MTYKFYYKNKYSKMFLVFTQDIVSNYMQVMSYRTDLMSFQCSKSIVLNSYLYHKYSNFFLNELSNHIFLLTHHVFIEINGFELFQTLAQQFDLVDAFRLFGKINFKKQGV